MNVRFSTVWTDTALSNFGKIVVFCRDYIAVYVQACVMVRLPVGTTGQVVGIAQRLII